NPLYHQTEQAADHEHHWQGHPDGQPGHLYQLDPGECPDCEHRRMGQVQLVQDPEDEGEPDSEQGVDRTDEEPIEQLLDVHHDRPYRSVEHGEHDVVDELDNRLVLGIPVVVDAHLAEYGRKIGDGVQARSDVIALPGAVLPHCDVDHGHRCVGLGGELV